MHNKIVHEKIVHKKIMHDPIPELKRNDYVITFVIFNCFTNHTHSNKDRYTQCLSVSVNMYFAFSSELFGGTRIWTEC